MPISMESIEPDDLIPKAFKTWKSKLLVPILEYYLLSVIKKEMRYGGQLVEMAKKELDGDIKIPTVYAMLKRATEYKFLTEEQIIKEEIDGPKTRGIARRYYVLTNSGEQYLNFLSERIENTSALAKRLEELS